MCARVNFSYLISQYYSFILFYSIKYSLVLHIIILNDVAIAQMRLFVLYLSRYLAWPELIFRRILIIVPADLSLKSIKISLNELNKCLQITDFCKFVVIVFFFLSFVSRLFSLLSFLVELRNLVCEYGADMTGLRNPSLNYHFQTLKQLRKKAKFKPIDLVN